MPNNNLALGQIQDKKIKEETYNSRTQENNPLKENLPFETILSEIKY